MRDQGSAGIDGWMDGKENGVACTVFCRSRVGCIVVCGVDFFWRWLDLEIGYTTRCDRWKIMPS